MKKMKTWFDNNRIDMFNSACTKMLRTEICNGLSIKEMEHVLATLELLNTGKLAETGGITVANHDVDLGNEIKQAISAEVVAMEDNDFISELNNNIVTTKQIDFKTYAGKPTYVGDNFAKVEAAIKESHKILDTGKQFILCAPLELSVLQASTKSTFSPQKEGSFKGPNNTILAGYLDKKSVYTYMPQSSRNFTLDDCKIEYLVGVYYEKEDRCIMHKIVVDDFAFM